MFDIALVEDCPQLHTWRWRQVKGEFGGLGDE
jgi:hypothetical protein